MNKKNLVVRKAVVGMAILATLQVLALGALVILLINDEDIAWLGGAQGALLVAALLVILNGILAVRETMMLWGSRERNEMLIDTVGQMEKLNLTLRAQRHDFLNHLQVLHGLMEMEEYAAADEYIGDIYSDIKRVSRMMRTAQPAVNALLQAKAGDCEQKGLQFELQVGTRLEHLAIEPWALCRVLGNLIDNAAEAVMLAQRKGTILVELSEDLKSYRISVHNNGPEIPASLREQIFKPGFSTKGDERGMGLAIVSHILEENGGSIALQSDGNGTTFSLRLPKA